MTSSDQLTPRGILESLQKEAWAWTKVNFPNQTPHQPLLGIIEELGEFWEAADDEAHKDAIADILVFSANYCSHNGWSIADLWDKASQGIAMGRGDAIVRGYVVSGRLCHHRLKSEQGIRGSLEAHKAKGEAAMLELLQVVAGLGVFFEIEPIAEAWRVWNENVKKRDWRPATA